MHVQRTRWYYGWVVVAIAFLTMMLIVGTFFSSGVLFAAIVAEYGWSHATTSLPFSVALICYAIMAWFAGQLFDRYGPRRLFPLGAVCFGVGLIASALAQTPWHLCLTWGLLVGMGYTLAGFVPNLALVALWFSRRLGLASGFAVSGMSLGGLVIVPGAQYLVNQYGWRLAYALIGVVVIAVLVPLNAIWQRHRPADLGLYPDGAAAPPMITSAPETQTSAASWTLRQALRTERFWLLVVFSGGIGWLSQIISVHQIAHLIENGLSSLLAASVVGLMGLVRAPSSAIWGWASDRYRREVVYTLGTLLCIFALACLALLHQPWSALILYGFALTYALGGGVQGTTQATATADVFGARHLGAILGALEIGWGLGGFGGAWFGGYWHDHWGSYHGAFLITIGVCLLGCAALWLAAPRKFRRGLNRSRFDGHRADGNFPDCSLSGMAASPRDPRS
jgi:MFS family permease